MAFKILIIAGPTASGKTARAVKEALARGGEIISVDSRQVYRGLDVGTEKATLEERRGVSSTNGLVLDVPHHLLDVREPEDAYSAADFVTDAERLIAEISARGKLPILAGGTHYYFDALLRGLPEVPPDATLRAALEHVPTEELYARVRSADARRAPELDPKNRRRLIRALEIIAALGAVPERPHTSRSNLEVEWVLLEPDREKLRARLDAREASKFSRGLVEEVARVRAKVGDERLNELGLEYRIVGEYLRGERSEESLLPTLSAKLWQYARRQYAWLRKLRDQGIAPAQM